MLHELTSKLISGLCLSLEEAETAVGAVLSDSVSDAEIAAFLTALSIKGETPEELAGAARAMRIAARGLKPPAKRFVDTAGTGGGLPTFNISTAAAIVAAAAGIPVAKHGNRAVTSSSGSADVLKALGVRIDAEMQVTQQCLDKAGIAFMFAPLYHPAMKRVAGVRKALKRRTAFNLLGPLTNPAGAPCQVIGVYDAELIEPVARALALLGTVHSLVVHSEDGLDECSVFATTQFARVREGSVDTGRLEPDSLRCEDSEISDILVSHPQQSAGLILGVLQGQAPRAARNMTILNAAAAIHVADDQPLATAIERATAAIDSGKAFEKLSELKRVSHA